MKTELQPYEYLQELIQDRVSSKLKLIAAWDGLSIETQIKILNNLTNIPDEIIAKGLSSPNDYIRYLISDRFFHCHEGTDENRKLLKLISNDENILVRFTKFDSQKIYAEEKNEDGKVVIVLKPEKFFSMNIHEQILYFSDLRVSDADKIIKIVEWGFNHQIDPNHLANLIKEVSYNFKKNEVFYDGGAAYFYAKDLENLWRLILKLESSDPAQYLTWLLPTSGGLFIEEVFFEDLLKHLPKELAINLLKRRDFYCFSLRKKIITSKKMYDAEVRAAAESRLKEYRAFHKQERRDSIKSFSLIGLFLYGLIALYTDIRSWIGYVCIVLPFWIWFVNNIKDEINTKIDEVINKIDKKIAKRFHKFK